MESEEKNAGFMGQSQDLERVRNLLPEFQSGGWHYLISCIHEALNNPPRVLDSCEGISSSVVKSWTSICGLRVQGLGEINLAFTVVASNVVFFDRSLGKGNPLLPLLWFLLDMVSLGATCSSQFACGFW